MGDIRTSISLQDNFSAPLRRVVTAMNAAAAEAEKLQKAMGGDVDTTGIKEYQKGLDIASQMEKQATQTAQEYSTAQLTVESQVYETANAAEAYANELRAGSNTAEQASKAALNEANALDKAEHEAEQYSEAVSKAASESDRLGSSGANAGELLRDAFTTLGIVTALKKIADGFIECAQAAIEYESAVTGVYKTVDGSDAQLEQISSDIKSMALEIPATTTEIAGVAESAGQLGIATKDITDFTEVMINLGVATNLTSDEAASSLAKFANITGMAASDYENLGSTIVDLGNNFATTEADIVAMSTRMASAGTLAGLTESDILGLSAAMSSVGIEAEAGGSAMSTLLTDMQVAVETGNKALTDFASVAGMTGEQFQKAFKQDAASALYAFIDGLNDVGRNGKTATVILEDMGIKEIRLSNAVKALANNSEGLAGAIDLAGAAWNENTALAEEAGKRYGTLESRLEITRNAANNLKIAVGDVLTPAIGNFADKGTEALVWLTEFAEKNPVVVEGITGITVAVAAAAGTITAVTAAAKALDAVTKTFDLTLSKSKIGIILGGIAAAGVAIGGIIHYFNSAEKSVEDYSGTLEQCSGEIESTQTAYENVCKMYGANSDAAKSLEDDLKTLNAQYEKGGGFIADYDKRLDDSKKAINAMTTEYHDKLTKINDDWKNGLVAVAQLDALSGKTELTNADLDMMSKYADYLNDTFNCNIEVNYDTGELTNFNPEDITDSLTAQAKENRIQAATEYVVSDEFTDKYIDSIDNLDAIEKDYKAKRDKINAAIADYTVSNDTGYTLEELDEEYGKRIKEAQGQIADIENEARDAYGIIGIDGVDEYLENVRQMSDSFQELEESAQNAYESMTPVDGAKEALSGISDEIQLLAQNYDEAYESAVESFQGQWGLFDEASANAEATVASAQAALDSQLAYWTSYQSNVEYMSQVTAKELGVTQQEYDSFMSYVRDGSPEAVGLIADMRQNIEHGNTEAVQKIIETHGEIETKQSEIGQTIAKWSTNFEENLDMLVRNAKRKINELDMSAEAKRGATNTLNSYADQILAQTDQAVNSAQSVVDAVQAVFDNANISYTPVKGSDKAAVSGHAEGTISAASGYALVGEEGPELIRFSGGERVYNAAETIRLMSDPKSLELPGLWKNAYASGTDSAARGIALVGEKGPELVFMNGGEKVYTASETERIFRESPVYRDYSTAERRIIPSAANFGSLEQSVLNNYGNTHQSYSKYDLSELSAVDNTFSDIERIERPLHIAPPVSGAPADAEPQSAARREYVLTINGKGSIKADGVSKDDVLGLLIENVKPVLMEIIEQEMFEEGEAAYET